jgi:NADPH:quinone reductase-like Zn-dependent oxidoreductase
VFLIPRSVADHRSTRNALIRRTAEVFDFVSSGRVTPHIGKRYALADAAEAHRDIESRHTVEKLLLLPSRCGSTVARLNLCLTAV